MPTNTADIRPYLTSAYNDEELTTLCADYFRDVYDNFTTGMTKTQKIQLLLDHCQRRDLMTNLLAALERDRPDQYRNRFGPAVVEPSPATAPPGRDPRQVFISHAHEDAEFAHRLAADLRTRGWRVWIAPDSIRHGEMWVEAISRGLEESSVFVLVLTEAAVRSRWVKSEANVAIEMEHRGKLRFVPLEVSSRDVPAFWSAYQFVPFRGQYQDALMALILELEQISSSGERTVQSGSTTGTRSKTLPASISIETLGGVATPLLRKGTFLPATVTQVFSTAEDNQAEVEVVLVFGDNRMARDNRLIGNFRLIGIPPAPRGVPQIRVEVSVDKNMILMVTATDQATQRTENLGARNLGDCEPPKITDPLPSQTGSAQTQIGYGDINDLFGGGADFSDFFGTIFGGMSANSSRPNVKAAERAVEISLEEAASGTQRLVEYGGRRLEVRIPPGVRTGTKVRCTPNKAAPGKFFYLAISVEKHPLFIRNGNDLHLTLPVSAKVAEKGGQVRVPGLKKGDAYLLSLPPKTRQGASFRLAGTGIPDLKTSLHGDMIVSIEVFDPRKTQIDTQQRRDMIIKSLNGMNIED
jgi:hypothetical protein